MLQLRGSKFSLGTLEILHFVNSLRRIPSHVWMPPLCLQELKVKVGAPRTFNGLVTLLQALAPKKCLISISVPAEEGMGHGIRPVAEILMSQSSC